MGVLRALFFICCIQSAAFNFTEPACEIELWCPECLPEHMPLVESHRAAGGRVRVAAGEAARLSCGAGRLLAYPQRARVSAVCEAGRFRVAHDSRLRHLLELGCQQSVFEDVLHDVEYCAPPLQGRAYRAALGEEGVRHLAAVCYDADRGVATCALAGNAPALRLPPHAERDAPRSLFGNFNQMFDAETRAAAAQLFSDAARTNRRLRELFRHERVEFAAQELAAAALLSPLYFEDQDMRVADFVSNKVLAWRSVAQGNLQLVQRDVARLLRAALPRHLLVLAGTHGTAALRTSAGRTPIFLKGKRFPVPKYIWTVVVEAGEGGEGGGGRALAVAVLNEPFVAVSEVRESVFCESACARAGWLRAARAHRAYETPLLGLTFCCDAHEFADHVPEFPRQMLANVTRGERGMLLDAGA